MDLHQQQTGESYWSREPDHAEFCVIRCASKEDALRVARSALSLYSGPDLGLKLLGPLNILSNPDPNAITFIQMCIDRPLASEIRQRRELFAPVLETSEGIMTEVLFDSDVKIAGLIFRGPVDLGETKVEAVDLNGTKLY